MNDTDISQWDTYAELYERGMGPTGDALHTALIDPLIRSYTGNTEGKTIVDLGCGNGYLCGVLGAFASYIGVDSSAALIQKAKTRYGETPHAQFLVADITKPLAFPQDAVPVDTVVLSMVVQYLPDLSEVINTAAGVLRHGGTCIVILDHPAHALFARAQALAGKKEGKFLDLKSYFDEGPRSKTSLWGKATLSYYHRTVASYVRPFSGRFHLDQMDEVTEDGETPRILGFKWSKEI